MNKTERPTNFEAMADQSSERAAFLGATALSEADSGASLEQTDAANQGELTHENELEATPSKRSAMATASKRGDNGSYRVGLLISVV